MASEEKQAISRWKQLLGGLRNAHFGAAGIGD
jgi:hypothetical protein